MEHEKHFVLCFDDDAFAQPSQANDRAALNGGQRRIHGTQQERACQPNTQHAVADNARCQRAQVEKNVWQFRHGSLLPYPSIVARRLTLIAAGILLVVGVGAAFAFYELMSGDGVRLALERQGTNWLGQPVRIGSATARIFPRPGLTLHDVRAGEPVRFVLADLQISTGLKPLWSRRIVDAEIAVSNSRIDLPLPFTLPEHTSTDTAPCGMQLESIRTIALHNITSVSRGREITLSADASLSQNTLRVQRLTAQSGATTLEAAGDIRLAPRLDADLQVRARQVDVDDLIALADAFAPRAPHRASSTAALLPGRIVARVIAESARASGVDVRQFVTTVVAQGIRITLSTLSIQ